MMAGTERCGEVWEMRRGDTRYDEVLGGAPKC